MHSADRGVFKILTLAGSCQIFETTNSELTQRTLVTYISAKHCQEPQLKASRLVDRLVLGEPFISTRLLGSAPASNKVDRKVQNNL